MAENTNTNIENAGKKYYALKNFNKEEFYPYIDVNTLQFDPINDINFNSSFGEYYWNMHSRYNNTQPIYIHGSNYDDPSAAIIIQTKGDLTDISINKDTIINFNNIVSNTYNSSVLNIYDSSVSNTYNSSVSNTYDSSVSNAYHDIVSNTYNSSVSNTYSDIVSNTYHDIVSNTYNSSVSNTYSDIVSNTYDKGVEIHIDPSNYYNVIYSLDPSTKNYFLTYSFLFKNTISRDIVFSPSDIKIYAQAYPKNKYIKINGNNRIDFYDDDDLLISINEGGNSGNIKSKTIDTDVLTNKFKIDLSCNILPKSDSICLGSDSSIFGNIYSKNINSDTIYINKIEPQNDKNAVTINGAKFYKIDTNDGSIYANTIECNNIITDNIINTRFTDISDRIDNFKFTSTELNDKNELIPNSSDNSLFLDTSSYKLPWYTLDPENGIHNAKYILHGNYYDENGKPQSFFAGSFNVQGNDLGVALTAHGVLDLPSSAESESIDQNSSTKGDLIANTITSNEDIICKNDVSVKNNIYANYIYSESDERLKTFTKPIDINLDTLSGIKKSYFKFTGNPNKAHIGVSAQEIQKLYPEIVHENNETGFLSVDYAKLSVVALAAVDKLNEEIKYLKEEINKLKNKKF